MVFVFLFIFFFFNDTATTEIYTLSLHDALPISSLPEDARIVDIAGGSGWYASQMVRVAPLTVVGIDISRSMIEQRAEDPLLVENHVGDMEALPFEDASFDAALFVGALH